MLVHTLSAQNSWLLSRITLSHVAMELTCCPAEGEMESLKNGSRHFICMHWIAHERLCPGNYLSETPFPSFSTAFFYCILR